MLKPKFNPLKSLFFKDSSDIPPRRAASPPSPPKIQLSVGPIKNTKRRWFWQIGRRAKTRAGAGSRPSNKSAARKSRSRIHIFAARRRRFQDRHLQQEATNRKAPRQTVCNQTNVDLTNVHDREGKHLFCSKFFVLLICINIADCGLS